MLNHTLKKKGTKAKKCRKDELPHLPSSQPVGGRDQVSTAWVQSAEPGGAGTWGGSCEQPADAPQPSAAPPGLQQPRPAALILQQRPHTTQRSAATPGF